MGRGFEEVSRGRLGGVRGVRWREGGVALYGKGGLRG